MDARDNNSVATCEEVGHASAGELPEDPPGESPSSQRRYLAELIEAGLLIPTGVDGLYGRSAGFEAIADGLDAAIARIGKDQQAEVMRFPPAMSRKVFEASEYLNSFPQLAGTVHSFCGNDGEHRRLLARLHDGEDWTEGQRATQAVLTPAACYPVYSIIAGRGPLPPEGRTIDVMSYCFRHEPSMDPARMQSFRMREFVRFGTAEQIVAFRRLWMDRGAALADALGLSFELDVANDPFFGRGGKIVADGQREQKLKFELLVPIHAGAPATACMSFNYHKDHFAQVWSLRTAQGEHAHTGCVGFGIERLILALLRQHGFHLARWPAGVRKTLELDRV